MKTEAGKYRRQEEKGIIEDEMVRWHHQLNGHEFEQALGDGEGKGSLMGRSPWDRRVGQDLGTQQQYSFKGLNCARGKGSTI